jgi:hypothetical protein
MTPIEKLLHEYKEAEEWSQKDLASWPANTRPGAEGRVRQARAALDDLKTAYGDLIRQGAFTIFPTGPGAEEFARVAAEEASAIRVSALSLYSRLAKEIEPSLGDRRTFGITQLGLLINAVTDVARELGMRNLPPPRLDDVAHCPDTEALIGTIRTILRQAMGPVLDKAAIEAATVEGAIRIRYTRTVVPVIVMDATAEDLKVLPQALFNGTTFTVETTSDESVDTVLAKLADIRKNLKKKN